MKQVLSQVSLWFVLCVSPVTLWSLVALLVNLLNWETFIQTWQCFLSYLVDLRILPNRVSVLLGNCLFCKCQMIPWVVGEIPFQFLYSWLTKRRFCSMFLPFKKGLSVTTNGLYLTLIQSSEDLTFFISF